MGYFDLIDQVDCFVFLDNVQFSRQSWQQRNRVKMPDGLGWITVPVAISGRFGQSIAEAPIKDQAFTIKHSRTVEMNYRRSPYFQRFFPFFEKLLKAAAQLGTLGSLNIQLIEGLVEALGIARRFVRASELQAAGKRTELLAGICCALGAREYLSPLGSAVYLNSELEHMEKHDIRVSFQQYVHPDYPQLFPPFSPYASVVDLIFNTGSEALAVVRAGRRPAYTPEEARLLCVQQVHSET